MNTYRYGLKVCFDDVRHSVIDISPELELYLIKHLFNQIDDAFDDLETMIFAALIKLDEPRRTRK